MKSSHLELNSVLPKSRLLIEDGQWNGVTMPYGGVCFMDCRFITRNV